MTAAYRLLQIRWFLTRPRTFGVRAIVVTPENTVVMLRHSYVRGWYLPGGGLGPGEDPRTAILRELREEIGLEDFGAIRQLWSYEHRPDYKHDRVDVFLVEGARYRWVPSIEIEDVRAFDPRTLPADTSERTLLEIREWLGSATGR